jgi:uncharacterized protein
LKFPKEIHSELKYYVYKLIDPRDGLIFYIGKGSGDRIFSHVKGALAYEGDEDAASTKIKTIQQIINARLEPIHIVHRHGMTELEAIQVEAALIDATPGLTNQVAGHGSSDFGPDNTLGLIERYKLEQMEVDPDHKIILININRSFKETSVYEGVRLAWRMSRDRAEKADFIFAVSQGICKGVFVAHKWLPATAKNFPERLNEDVPERSGFVGKEAPLEVQISYKDKRLPDHMQRKKGNISPVRYFY